MRIKGIPVWEQYFEFIVLGVAGLVLLAFGSLQLLRGAPTVEVAGREIKPDAVIEELESEADVIWTRMRPEADPPLQLEGRSSATEQFRERLASSIIEDDTLDIPQVAIALDPAIGAGVGANRFVVPAVPAPRDRARAQYFDSLEPGFVMATDGLAERFESEPYDMSWITVSGEFDWRSVLDQMTTPGRDGAAAVPEAWHDGRVLAFDVLLERQTRQSDGSWGDSAILDPLLGSDQVQVREALDGDVDAPFRDKLVAQLGKEEAQRLIVQPAFYPARAGNWEPPSARAEVEVEIDDEDREQAARLQARLESLRDQRGKVEERLEEAGGPLEGPPDRGPDRPSGGSGSGGGGGGPLGGGGDGGMTQGGDDAQKKANDRTRRRLTSQLNNLNRDIERAMNELEVLVGVPSDEEAEGGEPDGLWEEDTYVIWAHDDGVEVGREYRYRFTVRVYNPFFAKGLQLVEDQKELAEDLTLDSEPSVWSEPIMVDPPIRAYVLEAVPPGLDTRIGGRGMGHATFEIYRFHDARWWSERFSNVEPGDRVGTADSRPGRRGEGPQIDYATDYVVLDIIRDLRVLDGPSTEKALLGSVVLQNVRRPDEMERRRPLDDQSDPVRMRLADEAALVDAGSDLDGAMP